MASSDQPNWSEIRRRYLDGVSTLAAIAVRHGVSVQRIYRHARREGWPERPPRVRGERSHRPSAKTPPPKAKPASPDRSETSRLKPPASPPGQSLKARRVLVRRLYKAIDTKLQQMERRMAHDMATAEGTTDTTAADHERDSRAIGALIANLSRVTEIEADLERIPGAANPANQQADRQLADEAERFRREVAERLARLVRPA